MSRRPYLTFIVAFGAVLAALAPARATDEIQVYNAEIAAVGQWTVQQHLNYTVSGKNQPDFPGGLVANRSLQGTPEFAYGVTDFWELGLYLPFAVDQNGAFLSNGAKLRTLFVVPNADKRNFFYGMNFELSYLAPRFSQQRWGLEIRPIVGVRNDAWEFIVNPIVDFSFGTGGETTFAPAARLARNLGNDVFVGVEYYTDLGPIDRFLPLQEQSHQLFLVSDFKLGAFDVDVGVGYGLTGASDKWVTKAIFGYAFPVDGAPDAGRAAGMSMAKALRTSGRAAAMNTLPAAVR